MKDIVSGGCENCGSFDHMTNDCVDAPMQPPKTVEEAVNELADKTCCGGDLCGRESVKNHREQIRTAIAFGRTLGLQEALGAGGTRCKPEELAGVAAKNSAISALIEKGEQGTL